MTENTNTIIKILPAEGCNPEYAPSKEAQEGMEFSGFLLLGFDEDKDMVVSSINGISAHIISEAIWENKDEETVSVLRQAMAVAEGQIRAMEIFRQTQKRNMKKDLGRILEILKGGDEDDEAGD